LPEPTARPQNREDRLITLMEIARTITSSLDLGEVLARVLEGAVRFSGAQRGYLFLKEQGGLVPWTSGAAGHPSVEVSQSVAEEVARTGRPIYRDQLGGGEGRSVTDSILRLRLQAVLCLPLAIRQDVIGVVYLDSRRRLPHHQPDLPLLEALAGLAAVAIQNSRLVGERLRAERTLAIGQMASAIVHDLRSPLAAIRGIAELCHERAAEGGASRTHLATIISEVDRLTELTEDLLQFSKQAPPLEPVEVGLAEVVDRTLSPLHPRLMKAGVRVAVEVPPEARVAADPARMVRVLHNLIANSLEAMPEGGRLTLSGTRVGNRWRLTVRDTGRGMPEETRRRVFEPFFSSGKAGGTGLGMAIVMRIVEEHRARIAVESAPGQGTTVALTFPPLADGCGPAPTPGPRATDPAAGPRRPPR
jgi:signal transduction histidine kinase